MKLEDCSDLKWWQPRGTTFVAKASKVRLNIAVSFIALQISLKLLVLLLLLVSKVSDNAYRKQDDCKHNCPPAATAAATRILRTPSGARSPGLHLILFCRRGGWSTRSLKSDFSSLDMANDTAR